MHWPYVEQLNTEALWLEALPILQVLWPELLAEAYVRSLASMQEGGYVLFGIRSGAPSWQLQASRRSSFLPSERCCGCLTWLLIHKISARDLKRAC
jgi:hypothetical protein